MSGVKGDSDALLKIAQLLIDTVKNIEHTKRSLKDKYDDLGDQWNDDQYKELGETIEESNKALNDVQKAYSDAVKGIAALLNAIQKYEDTSLDGAVAHPTGKTIKLNLKPNNQNEPEKKKIKISLNPTGGSSAGTPSSATASDPISAVKQAGKDWTKTLSKDERDAIKAYTEGGNEKINEMLRNKKSPINEMNAENKSPLFHRIKSHVKEVLKGKTPDYDSNNCSLIQKDIDNIHQALSRSEIPCECTVYRGCPAVFLGDYQNFPDEKLDDVILPSDEGFMSTSLTEKSAFDNQELFLKILVPKGARGAYINDLSVFGSINPGVSNQDEVLFDKGRRLRVIHAYTNKSGQRIIQARMLL